jgi:hypothetical protein
VSRTFFNSSFQSFSKPSQKYVPLILWVLVIACTAWCSEGWLQPDEHARVLEPAHFIAYGYASLPWELSGDHPIVSWLLGVLVSPVLMITKSLQLSGQSEAAIIRFLVGILASTRFIAFWKILDLLRLQASRRVFYILVMMLAVFGPLFFVRTSQENFAATALAWALLMALKIQKETLTTKRGFIFGCLLALTFSARPQVGLAAAGLGLWMLKQQGPAIILPAAGGIALGLLPMAIVDVVTTGIPFLPAFNYLKYALGDEDGGKVWGTSPWWFYMPQFIESWYPPLSIVLAIPLLIGVYYVPSLTALIVPFALVHFILGHKETRYFSPMIPFMQLSMFAGIEWLEKRYRAVEIVTSAKGFWTTTLKVLAFLTLIGGLFPLNTSPWMYSELGHLLRSGAMTSFTYVGNTMSGFSQFYAKIPQPPAYTQISWNDVRDGKATPSGWLAFYALDPDDFRIIQKTCESEGLYQLPDWLIRVLQFSPRSPARRRLNPIIYCKKPLQFSVSP